MTLRGRALVLTLLGLLSLSFAPQRLAAQQPKPLGASAERPPDAPVLGTRPELPPLPPEYLRHDQAGIRFAYHPSARDRVRPLIEMTEEVRAALRAALGAPVLARAEIRVGMGPADLARITPLSASSAGTSFGELELVIIDLGAPPGCDAAVARGAFRHGLAHLALDEVAAGRPLPRWLHEGFALDFGDAPSVSTTLGLGWQALLHRLLLVGQLDAALREARPSESLVAFQAADFVRYLQEDDRGARFPELVRQLARGEIAGTALGNAYGVEAKQLELAWRADLGRRAVFVPWLAAGLALAGLGAAATIVGRRRSARRLARRRELARLSELGQRAARAAPELRVRLIQIRGSDLEGRDPTLDMPLGEPPSESVPKISHDGCWHTLH